MATQTEVDRNYGGASPRAIQRHYDLGNDFWRLWLDPNLTYSCAFWDGADDLATAQVKKFDYLIESANAPGSARVLDVGCGWGGMIRRMLGAHSVGHATGLTLSRKQVEWIESWGDPRIEVRLENWADHTPEEPYDAIVSAGAFEHFARADDTREENLESYRRFFKMCHDQLRDGGRLALQTIAKGNARLDRDAIENARFIWRHIFQESEVPWLADVARASEKRFEILSVRNDAEHYAQTAAAWHDGLTREHDRIVELVGDDTYGIFERYLRAVVQQFERRHLGLMRVVMQKV
jgi:cyclopropane-fatty-acyl-phospholipid synthase